MQQLDESGDDLADGLLIAATQVRAEAESVLDIIDAAALTEIPKYLSEIVGYQSKVVVYSSSRVSWNSQPGM